VRNKALLSLYVADQIGENADLLVRSDVWLQTHRDQLVSELYIISNQLHAIDKAITLKRMLQQSNLVPVQNIITKNDEITNVEISVQKVNDAVNSLNRDTYLASANADAQIDNWLSDGYTIEGSQ
jgi:hypothetical protein